MDEFQRLLYITKITSNVCVTITDVLFILPLTAFINEMPVSAFFMLKPIYNKSCVIYITADLSHITAKGFPPVGFMLYVDMLLLSYDMQIHLKLNSYLLQITTITITIFNFPSISRIQVASKSVSV